MTSNGDRAAMSIWLSVLGTPKGRIVCRIDPVEDVIRIPSPCELRYQCSAAVRKSSSVTERFNRFRKILSKRGLSSFVIIKELSSWMFS